MANNKGSKTMKIFGKERMKQAWKDMMHSTHRKISCGADNISRLIKSAHNSQWRRHKSEWGHQHPKHHDKH